MLTGERSSRKYIVKYAFFHRLEQNPTDGVKHLLALSIDALPQLNCARRLYVIIFFYMSSDINFQMYVCVHNILTRSDDAVDR